MIKVSHLKKKFGKSVAVNDVTFNIETGKVTGFLGPNGAGKSTTMRLMLSLDMGEGSTSFDGKNLHDYDEPSKVVGILLEAKAYHPTRTAKQHLNILATEANIPLTRVDEALETVGLLDVADRRPGKFSLGMSQRLGIAAAILAKPKYLILDEPANGLDPEGIVWLREFLKDYADAGNGVFVSSHLLSEMSQMADNVIVIGKGKLIASTSISELVAGNTKSSVFVRTNDNKKLEKIISSQSSSVKSIDKGLEVQGMKTDDIGKIAYSNDLTILELTNRQATLEEVFLDLTEGSEEFKGKDEVGPKKS